MIDLSISQDILGWIMAHGSYLAGVCLVLYYTYFLIRQACYFVNDKESKESLVEIFFAVPASLAFVFFLVLVIAGVYIAFLQWLGLILALTVGGVCGTLLVARGVVRLKKKLDAHTNDKDAHKG